MKAAPPDDQTISLRILLGSLSHECVAIGEELIHWIDSMDKELPNKRSILVNSTLSQKYENIPIGSYQLTYQWIYSLNTCTQELTRNMRIKGICEDPLDISIHTQIVHRSDFEILFPRDQCFTNQEYRTLNMDSIYTQIHITDDDYELIGIHYEDQQIDKQYYTSIQRTWTAIDWCAITQSVPDESTEIVINSQVSSPAELNCDFRHLKDGGDGIIRYQLELIVAKPNVFQQTKIDQSILPKNRFEKNQKNNPRFKIIPNPLYEKASSI